MFASYRRLLTHPGVPHLIFIGLVIRLSTPVLSLALLLTAVDRLGSYAAAGLVLSGHALAVAAGAPLGGRLADRYGPRRVLTGYLAAHALAYALLLVAMQGSAAAMIAGAVALGATNPPAGAVLRSAWPRVVPAEFVPTAYAVDNAVNELSFVLGPLIVPLLALAIPANIIVIAAGAAVLLGGSLLLVSAAVRHTRAAMRTGPTGVSRFRTLAGPLSHGPTVLLLTVAALGTFAFGSLRVGTVASAAAFGSAASAGVLMGLLSAGALVGTLAYGARAWSGNGGRLLILVSLAEAGVLLSSGHAPDFAVLAILITLVGLITGPRDALVPSLLADHSHVRQHTEVFAWLNTFMWTGYGLGTAVAGQLTAPQDSGTASFGAAATAALAGTILAAIASRMRFRSPAEPRKTAAS